jgi:GntR family transcriptional regulator / MocR family aminotransferase
MIAIDRKSPRPLHKQIYDAYRVAVVDGTLRPGHRVPSSRELAGELGVSRFPVVNAYAQLLAEGYFTSRAGSGTVVSHLLPERFVGSKPSIDRAPSRSEPRTIAKSMANLPPFQRPSWLQGRGAFRVGQVASEEFPLKLWSSLVARHCRRMDAKAFDYGERAIGSKHLREQVCNYLKVSRAVRCEPEQVMIVTGSQQALEIAGRVLLDPGNAVWVEEPGYGFAQKALSLSGCQLIPVPVDKEGMNVAAGMQLCRKARAAVVTPSHQFPLGITMSASRRMQLLEWAMKNGSWIIEDDYESEFRYKGAPISSLQGLDSNGRVIYVGTFSKVLFPSLRLGYVVAPPDLVEYFTNVRRAIDLGPPTFYQEVVAEFIAEGHFSRHTRRMRTLYHERRDALVVCLRKEFGSSIEVLGDEAGLQLVCAFPHGTADVTIGDKAAQEGLWVWPLSSSYLGKAPRPGFILGFGSTDKKEISEKVSRLARLVNGRK